MDYLNNITQIACPDGTTILEVPCPWCGRISKVKLNTKYWLHGLKAYKNGALVQHAWHTLSASERELLITGICDTCWKSL